MTLSAERLAEIKDTVENGVLSPGFRADLKALIAAYEAATAWNEPDPVIFTPTKDMKYAMVFAEQTAPGPNTSVRAAGAVSGAASALDETPKPAAPVPTDAGAGQYKGDKVVRTTPCCGFHWSIDGDQPHGPIYWNESNNTVQCHNCGQAFDQRPVPHGEAKEGEAMQKVCDAAEAVCHCELGSNEQGIAYVALRQAVRALTRLSTGKETK